jgi:SOS-response transcriptional repressor LexA
MAEPAGGNRKPTDTISAVVSFTNTSYRNDANPLDLNELVVKNPNSTFFMRIQGESWANQGIFPGDVAVIDRSLTPRRGDTVVAEVDGEFALTKLGSLETNAEAIVWGVVTHTVHRRR